MTKSSQNRARAEAIAARLPSLLARADRLATTVSSGDHGRRQPGLGDVFWQFRPAMPGDPAKRIDWRRSARSDTTFVQETEWHLAQSVLVWADRSASMHFASKGQESKAERAGILSLALAILLIRAGERVGTPELKPQRGEPQLSRLAQALDPAEVMETPPPAQGFSRFGTALFVSDFLGDLATLKGALNVAQQNVMRGTLLQVLDPVETTFPYRGRVLFDDMNGETRFETLEARGLRAEYKERLAERQDTLSQLAHQAGWHFRIHVTDRSLGQTLLALYHSFGAQ